MVSCLSTGLIGFKCVSELRRPHCSTGGLLAVFTKVKAWKSELKTKEGILGKTSETGEKCFHVSLHLYLCGSSWSPGWQQWSLANRSSTRNIVFLTRNLPTLKTGDACVMLSKNLTRWAHFLWFKSCWHVIFSLSWMWDDESFPMADLWSLRATGSAGGASH